MKNNYFQKKKLVKRGIILHFWKSLALMTELSYFCIICNNILFRLKYMKKIQPHMENGGLCGSLKGPQTVFWELLLLSKQNKQIWHWFQENPTKYFWCSSIDNL